MITTNVHRVTELTIQHVKYDTFRHIRIVMRTADGEYVEIAAFTVGDDKMQITTLPDQHVESQQASQ
jgi:stalled ribosome rescue protein Dom34